MAEPMCYVHYVYRDANYDCPVCEAERSKPKTEVKNVFYYKQFQPYYNVGLGCMINSKAHYKKVLKEKNCVEVGDCRVDQYHPRGRIK